MKTFTMIMIDVIDGWNGSLGPQFILGKNNELIPVHMGNHFSTNEFVDIVGIWIDTNDYNKINHDGLYVLIHEMGYNEDQINKKIEEYQIEIEYYQEIGTNTDPMSLTRAHIHIGFNLDEYINRKLN